MQRGELNGGKTAIVTGTLAFHETWSLDQTGNWQSYTQNATGGGTPTLAQTRTANRVNEITDISNSTGPGWVAPQYDAAGNMTRIPQPLNPSVRYSGIWDAWNRLVGLYDGETLVLGNAYDGLMRRIIVATAEGPRHIYYTAAWQAIEERLCATPATAAADRQFVWGLRYIDDLILRDRSTAGTLNERLDALQDANWNVTAIINTTGAVQERYAYSAYGVPLFLDPSFMPIGSSLLALETLFCGYRYDGGVGLSVPRGSAGLGESLGCWISRDLIGQSVDVNPTTVRLE